MKLSFFAIIFVFLSFVSVFSQASGEIEAAASSTLSSVSLPSNAKRIMPSSVPAEVSETIDKIVAGGEGKLRKGETEVLVWDKAELKKTGKSVIVNRMTDTHKVGGWQYEVGGEESGVTLFTMLKDGSPRRALAGFYGEADGVLVWAWAELLSNEQPAENSAVETPKPETRASAGRGAAAINLVGTWDNGSVSTVSRQNSVTGIISPSGGSRFEYRFTADGRFSYTGIIQTVNYSCTDTLFNERNGKYTLNGSTLTLTLEKNFWKKTNSCAASGNSERNYTLGKDVYTVSLKTNEYDQKLICLDNGKGEACYRQKS